MGIWFCRKTLIRGIGAKVVNMPGLRAFELRLVNGSTGDPALSCFSTAWPSPVAFEPCGKVSQLGDWLLPDLGLVATVLIRPRHPRRPVDHSGVRVYAVGIEMLNVERTPFEGSPTSVLNRWMIAASISVSAFTSGFGDIRGAAQGWMNSFDRGESLLGTLLWGLFIVAFSRKVIR